MAAQKISSNVKRTGSDGRKFYKPEFMAGVVADIRSGKTSITKASEDFHIHRTVIRNWLNKNEKGKRPARVPERTTVATEDTRRLIEKAYAAKPKATPAARAELLIDQQIELAEEFLADKIDEFQVKVALGRALDRRFVSTAWLANVFTGAERSGYRLKK